MYEALHNLTALAFIKVTGPQVLVRFVAGNQMIGDDQYGVPDCHRGPLLTSSADEAMEERRQVGVLRLGGRMAGFNQDLV
jgi:hypothetical protein